MTRIGTRALNRTTLGRQLLLDRADLSIVDATERLLGLNAQGPNLPYLALWNRLSGFEIKDLTAAIEDGSLVRSTLMRATQHLLSVPDFCLIRPAVAPLLIRVQRNAFGKQTAGIDLEELVADARDLLADGPLTRPKLGKLLAETRPGADANALGWTVQYLEPLVHPAPSGTWNVRGATPFARADWTGVTAKTDLPEMIRRYLAAFGPASVSDARAWSGVGGLKEIFEEMRPELKTYTDENGRELFDLPNAALGAEDLPAPVRLVPDFDAPLLAFADRTRVMTDEVRKAVCIGASVAATVLVDGTVAATWSTKKTKDSVELTVTPFRKLSKVERADIEAEAGRLLEFTDPDLKGVVSGMTG
ncbi:winged helix DNA-binding domain-containing protein [Amycolatopsis sp. NPDC059657]|uniref:winged helix DNA-binding domain-containing protein n=1 Tax=Amycolatopsis sp. NPDC059657 TaxID=3346899 RepID=UPI00366E25B3